MLRTVFFAAIFSLSLFAESPIAHIEANALGLSNAGIWTKESYELLRKYRVIFLGEIHGSKEMPLATYHAAQVLVSNGAKVVVALEIPKTEQAAINEYLRTGDIAVLKAMPFFKTGPKSGISSIAVAQMLARLRTMNVPVVCFDVKDGGTTTLGQGRDTQMGKNLLRALDKYPKHHLIVLTGNFHSRKTKGVPSDKNYRPAAYEAIRLSRKLKDSDVLSLMWRLEGGTAWFCKTPSTCGVQTMAKVETNYTKASTAFRYLLLDDKIYDGHNGTIFIRTSSVSYPLVPSPKDDIDDLVEEEWESFDLYPLPE